MFKKGNKLSRGRPKGVPNKSRETLFEICQRHNVIPFEALLILFKTSEKEEVQLGALKEACKYIYPSLKAIEMSGEVSVNPYAGKPLLDLIQLAQKKLIEK